jgi:hypothetical protein
MGMDDMLISLIGGGHDESGASGGDMLSGLLGMLGGGSANQSGGMIDLLGALIGGGQGMGQSAGSEVSGIAQQTGIPPELVMAGLSFLMGKLMGSSPQSSASGLSSGGVGLEALLQGQQESLPPAGGGMEELLQGMLRQQGTEAESSGIGVGLDELLQGQHGSVSGGSGSGMNLEESLQTMQSGQTGQYIESTGANQEFAEQTGLDPDQASQVLQGVLGALRDRSGGI